MTTQRFLVLSAFAILSAVLTSGCDTNRIPTGWPKTYGGSRDDNCSSVQQTWDSGYVLTGTTWSYGEGQDDVYLVRTNSAGEALWTQTFGGAGYDIGYSGRQTSDGGYILVGGTSSFGNRDQVYLVKVDATGAEEWSQSLGSAEQNEYGTSVEPTTDGGYIVAGWTSEDSGGVLLIKTDAPGNTLWSQVKGSPASNEYGAAVKPTSDGGYVIVGTTYQYDPNGDVWLAKTGADGNDAWEPKHFGGSSADLGNSVQQTTDGGYIIAGVTQSSGAGSGDMYLVKTDAAGNEVWSKTFGGPGNDGGRSVQQTTDGGYVIAGFTYSSGTDSSNVHLVKTDGNGNQMWYSTFGGSAKDDGASVQQTADGGYIIGGGTQSYGAGGWDMYLVKTGPAGKSEQ